MKLHVDLEPNAREEVLNKMLTDVYLYMENVTQLNEANAPRCSWCKRTADHLTECRATHENTYLLCQHCLADERRET